MAEKQRDTKFLYIKIIKKLGLIFFFYYHKLDLEIQTFLYKKKIAKLYFFAVLTIVKIIFIYVQFYLYLCKIKPLSTKKNIVL